MLRFERTAGLAALLFFSLLPSSNAAEIDFGGDGRYFQFVSFGDVPGGRNHAELGIFRLKSNTYITDELRFEVHGVFQVTSPAQPGGTASIASGRTRRYFDLEYSFEIADDVLGIIELDRLNLRLEKPSFRLEVGRQTMTWGVNYFWPVLDLFAPFAPERIDREYKPGIDAIRLTVPVGDFSEIEVVTAGQGERFPEDFSVASLGRFNVGTADVGYMGGRFHSDTVLGAFVTGDLFGNLARGEIAFTHSGDELDEEIDRQRFVRASFGLDRQLTAGITLTGEIHWNGFGAEDPEGYLRIAEADRVRRGEVTSLGRFYSGLSFGWQAHPLVMVSSAFLINWLDGSALIQPAAEWSASNSMVFQLGGIIGLGPGLDDDGQLQSEYGFVPFTLWGAFKVYF
jgi:hypothetical protein